MSNESQAPGTSLESALELIEAKSAQEFVSAMEARGDFKFKGIKRIFDQIHDWTGNFASRGILPSYEQIARDSEMPEDRVQQYLQELMGRGQSDARLVFAMPALQFIAGANAGISSMPIFCRPTQSEGTSARKYLQTYNEKNLSALVKWIEGRGAPNEAKYREYLTKAIQAEKLRDTQARNEIVKYFYTSLDDTPERRKLAYSLFARPVLQKLVDTKKLLLIKSQAPNGKPISGVFYPGSAEIDARLRILGDHYFQHVVKEGGEFSTDRLQQSLATIDAGRYEGMSEGQRQVVEELFLLAPTVSRQRKEAAETEKKKGLEEALDMLGKFPRVVEAAVLRNVSETTLQALRGVNGVLSAEFPHRGTLTDFYLHKSCVADAIKAAREAFDNSGDDAQVKILSAMGLEKYLDQDQYKAFLDLEQRVLFQQVPLLQKLWRMLFGRTKLDQKEVVKIKRKIQTELDKEKERLREREAKQAQKKLASERLQAETEVADAAKEKVKEDSNDSYEPPEAEDPEAVKEKLKNEEDAKNQLKKIVDIIDEAWSKNMHPNRTFLIEKLGNMSEDELIMFLKKYGRKEVLSFRVRSEKEEYIWPILITRRYLRRNGKSLSNKITEQANKQRNAKMPDQEKFNVASSIEDFLGKVLPKL
ncbi:MAG: hypothetical protein NXI24_20550 [bacterium]|nr:hypothetical protein [bacterium]